MPLAIYSGVAVQQQQTSRPGGRTAALPQGWRGPGSALPISAWRKAEAVWLCGRAPRRGNLGVPIQLPSAWHGERTRCSAAHQLKHSRVDKLRTAAAKPGLAHAELG